ncbi:retrovirus-related pol polyprotein from transposon TNT 1-94 [Tanacetum coccineum]
MNYFEEHTDGEAMIHSITHGEQPFPVITQVSLAGTAPNAPPGFQITFILLLIATILLKSYEMWQMRDSKYGKQDRKAVILYEYDTFKTTKGEKLLDTYLRYLQVINDLKKCALYNILMQNQGDVNDVFGIRKKTIVVTSDPLALVAEKTKVIKGKEKVIVHSYSKESNDEDISDLKKITTLLAKAFNRKKYYAKPTNNNLRTSSTSTSANKKPEYVNSEKKKEEKKEHGKKRVMSKVKCYNCKKEGHFSKDCKKVKVKDYNYYKTKMLLAKKDNDEKVLLAEDQAWMESSSDSDQELSANMVFMAKMEKILSDSKEKYYDNSTNYGLFMDNDDDQETFHDAIESASEIFDENHIVSQKDHDESEIDHNHSKEKDHLVEKLIAKFNQKIAKCQNCIEKANKQNTYLKKQNKALQDKTDVLNNQVNTFEGKSNEFDEQIKVLKEKNHDLLAQTEVLQDQLKVMLGLKDFLKLFGSYCC